MTETDIVAKMHDLANLLLCEGKEERSEAAEQAADTITALRAEVERLQGIISAADRGSPIYKAVERTLDEKSAWIARPNDEVTNAVALTAGIAWSIHYPLEVVEQNLSLQLDNHRLTARVAELEGDLNIMRLQRDAKRFTDGDDLSTSQPAPSPRDGFDAIPISNLRACASDKCKNVAAYKMQFFNVGANYCQQCARKISGLLSIPLPPPPQKDDSGLTWWDDIDTYGGSA